MAQEVIEGTQDNHFLSEINKAKRSYEGDLFLKESKAVEEKWTKLKLESATKKEAMRFNEGKEKWGLVNFEALKPMVQVLMYGAKKYEPRNWEKGLSKEEILESMLRHVFELLKGNLIDSESNYPHIGHIMCNALFYSYFTTVDETNARD